jgi:hypothetical protein
MLLFCYRKERSGCGWAGGFLARERQVFLRLAEIGTGDFDTQNRRRGHLLSTHCVFFNKIVAMRTNNSAVELSFALDDYYPSGPPVPWWFNATSTTGLFAHLPPSWQDSEATFSFVSVYHDYWTGLSYPAAVADEDGYYSCNPKVPGCLLPGLRECGCWFLRTYGCRSLSWATVSMQRGSRRGAEVWDGEDARVPGRWRSLLGPPKNCNVR